MRRRTTYCAAGCLLLAAGAAAGIGGQKYLHPAGAAVLSQDRTGDLTLCKSTGGTGSRTEAGTGGTERDTEAGTEGTAGSGADGKLTERQKRILRERHLPEDYQELTALQKESIRMIEELMQYLEEKYDRSFVFAEYHPPSVLEPDTVSMLFREEGDTRNRAAVIRRTSVGKDVRITDDFPAVAAEAVFEEALKEFVSDSLHTRCKVFGFISRADLEMPPDDMRQLEDAVTADACIWLPAESVTEAEAAEFADCLKDWLSFHAIRGRTQVMLLLEKDWERVNSRDYARYFSEDVCLYRKIIRIT